MPDNMDYNNDPSIRAFHRAPRSDMPATLSQALDATRVAAANLTAFEQSAADGHFPPPFVERERARLIAAVRVADEESLRFAEKHAAEQGVAIEASRYAAEARRSPQERLADAADHEQWLKSSMDGDELARRAEGALRAGQPELAQRYLDAARDKGARHTFDLDMAVADELDARDPDRKKAREVEYALEKDVTAFSAARLALLGQSVGVAPDGTAGNGTQEHVAIARANAKTMDFIDKRNRGEPYSAPVSSAQVRESNSLGGL